MNPAAWMLFVDGENFTIRAQELAKQSPPPAFRSRSTRSITFGMRSSQE